MKKINSFTVAFIAIISFCFVSCATTSIYAGLATISVPEEGGMSFVRITEDADKVASVEGSSATTSNAAPVEETGLLGLLQKVNNAIQTSNLQWHPNTVIAISPDGQRIAYINNKNKMKNIMEKNATEGGPSTQRTFRNAIKDFSLSPDGKIICFSEHRNGSVGIYLVKTDQSSTVRQISNTSANDYAPVMSSDGKTIYFHRDEGNDSYSLWSVDIDKALSTNYSRGLTPFITPNNENVVYCSRFTDKKESEIWKLDLKTGTEEILLSQIGKSYTTPQLSPDGKWILCTGSSKSPQGKHNSDIFVIRPDGTGLTQLTFHPGYDLSAIWSPDGKYIYFVSQRGSAKGYYNVWRMDFNIM